MSLEQAMAEVRRYLDAKNNAGSNAASWSSPGKTGSSAVSSAQFNMQGANIAGLSEIAARQGQVEPHSEMGAAGVFLKRAVRKVIGWYSRPFHGFDRATIAALRQVRQDMLGLQHQIAALHEEAANRTPATGKSVHAQTSSSEQDELLLLMIELFKNLVAVQALRQALREENPLLLERVEMLLSKVERESSELKAALLRQLAQGSDQ